MSLVGYSMTSMALSADSRAKRLSPDLSEVSSCDGMHDNVQLSYLAYAKVEFNTWQLPIFDRLWGRLIPVLISVHHCVHIISTDNRVMR